MAVSVEVNPEKQHDCTKKMRTVEISSPRRRDQVRLEEDDRKRCRERFGKREEDGGRKEEKRKSWEGRAVWCR